MVGKVQDSLHWDDRTCMYVYRMREGGQAVFGSDDCRSGSLPLCPRVVMVADNPLHIGPNT